MSVLLTLHSSVFYRKPRRSPNTINHFDITKNYKKQGQQRKPLPPRRSTWLLFKSKLKSSQDVAPTTAARSKGHAEQKFRAIKTQERDTVVHTTQAMFTAVQ